MLVLTKTCKKCGTTKPLDNINFPHNSKSKDGFDGYCKACWKIISQNKQRSKNTESPEGRAKAARVQVVKTSKAKAYEHVGSGIKATKSVDHATRLFTKPVQEPVPEGVQQLFLERLADLPRRGVKLQGTGGKLADAVKQYQGAYGVLPAVVYTYVRTNYPRMHFIPVITQPDDALEIEKENKMYGKDIKLGMKVVPVIKTIDGPLGKSKEWKAVLEDGKKVDKFLWVTKIAEKHFICSATKTATTGDKFAAIDLRTFPWTGWDSRSTEKTSSRPSALKFAKKTVAPGAAKVKAVVDPKAAAKAGKVAPAKVVAKAVVKPAAKAPAKLVSKAVVQPAAKTLAAKPTAKVVAKAPVKVVAKKVEPTKPATKVVAKKVEPVKSAAKPATKVIANKVTKPALPARGNKVESKSVLAKEAPNAVEKHVNVSGSEADLLDVDIMFPPVK